MYTTVVGTLIFAVLPITERPRPVGYSDTKRQAAITVAALWDATIVDGSTKPQREAVESREFSLARRPASVYAPADTKRQAAITVAAYCHATIVDGSTEPQSEAVELREFSPERNPAHAYSPGDKWLAFTAPPTDERTPADWPTLRSRAARLPGGCEARNRGHPRSCGEEEWREKRTERSHAGAVPSGPRELEGDISWSVRDRLPPQDRARSSP
jgi:hypothetical protein